MCIKMLNKYSAAAWHIILENVYSNPTVLLDIWH